MKNFATYLSEANKGLTIFDIDDTMFKTKAKVEVVNKKTNKKKELTPKQFNTYKLGRDEDFDFGQFKSAEIFNKTAMPIGKMISKFKLILKNAVKKGSKVILVTARADMDDKKLFLDTFRAHGIDIDKAHIYRAGNLGLKGSADAKALVFKQFLDTGEYSRIRLFDDDVSNLKALLSLKDQYNDVDFEAWKANDQGKIKRLK